MPSQYQTEAESERKPFEHCRLPSSVNNAELRQVLRNTIHAFQDTIYPIELRHDIPLALCAIIPANDVSVKMLEEIVRAHICAIPRAWLRTMEVQEDNV